MLHRGVVSGRLRHFILIETTTQMPKHKTPLKVLEMTQRGLLDAVDKIRSDGRFHKPLLLLVDRRAERRAMM